MSRTSDEIDLRSTLRILWTGTWLIAVLACLGLMLGGYYAYNIARPLFRATTIVEISADDKSLLDLNSIAFGSAVDAADINTTIEFIQSRELAEELVRRLSLLEDPEFNPDLVERGFSLRALLKGGLIWLGVFDAPARLTQQRQAELAFRSTVDAAKDALSVINKRETYLLEITARASEPTKAALMANTMAQIYIDAERAKNFQTYQAVTDWLTEQMTDIEKTLTAQEDTIATLRTGSDLVSQESLDALTFRLKDFRERRAGREAALLASDARLEDLNRALAGGLTSDILSTFNDPLLTRLGRQIGATVSETNTGFLARAREVIAQERADNAQIDRELTVVSASFANLLEQQKQQTEDLQRLNQLEQELAVTQNLHRTFLTGLRETTVQVGLVREDQRIMSTALPPLRPESPNRFVLTAVFTCLGAILGVAILLGHAALHSGAIRSSAQLEALSRLPVLGESLVMPLRKRQDLIRHYLANPTSGATEAIRNLRTSILMRAGAHRAQVIMLSSSIPGEGKTTLSVLLAANLAGLDKKVLLIEGDVRRCTLSEYFPDLSYEAATGAPIGSVQDAMNTLADVPQIAHHDPQTGVHVLFGAPSSKNAADMFSSNAFAELLTRCRAQYDHIIIDTPPVLVVPDARLIGPLADTLIYVVRWDRTDESQVRDGLRQFSSVGVNVSGMVLSQIVPKGMKRYGYGGRYGAYSDYGTPVALAAPPTAPPKTET